jgi:hypothetical protein
MLLRNRPHVWPLHKNRAVTDTQSPLQVQGVRLQSYESFNVPSSPKWMRLHHSAASRPRLPPRRVLRKVRLEIRSGKANTKLWRSTGDMPSQAPISSRVRPHPMQNPVSGSRTQIFTQGVSISCRLKWSIAPMWGVTPQPQWQGATPHVKTASILQNQLAVLDAETAEA